MRLAEIEAGRDYAVSVNPRQVQGLHGDPESIFSEPLFVARWLIHDVRDRSFKGVKATVLGIEEHESRTGGRKRRLVRVECVASRAVQREYVEDNYDGTKTLWHGIVEDEDDNPVMESISFEALIEPSQVIEDWTEALIYTETRVLNRILDHARERFER